MTEAVASKSGVADDTEGMSYLSTLPKRLVNVYLPLSIIVVVLLFPFYWMVMTAIKPKEQLLDLDKHNPYYTLTPTFEHIHDLLFKTEYPLWLWNTMFIAVAATILSLVASVFAAYAITRIRYRGAQWVGGSIFLAYLVPPSILFIPLSTVVYQYGLFDTPFALILTYPTILIPFSTWLLMGYFKTIPYELEECALIDGANRWQILTKIILPLAVPGLISASIFCLTLCWNEFIYALTFINSTEKKTVPVAILSAFTDGDQYRWQILTKIILPLAVPGLISASIFCLTLCWNEFIYALTFINSTEKKTVPVAILSAFTDGDQYRWGSLMAGALVGSLPLVVLYAFFVEHYVSAMTGAVKE